MADELQGALAARDAAKTEADAAMGALREAQGPMKKWTVRMTDGTVYQGVQAHSAEEARQKMVKGPQGPLAPKPAPTPFMDPAAEKARITGGMEDILRKAGRSEEDIKRTTGRIGGKLPGSWTEVAGAAVPMAVGALVPAGRTISRVGGQLFGNILGRGAVEAGSEILKPTGEGPLSAGARGMAKGVIPGVAQGALGAVLGPTKDTLRVQKMIQALKTELSPELASLITPSRPGATLSARVLRKMERAAGKKLDSMEAELSQGLRGQQFDLIDPSKRVATPAGFGYAKSRSATFEEIRQEIKDLREAAEIDRNSPFFHGQSQKNMKASAAIEADLLRQLQSLKKGNLAERYEAAITQHAKDSEALRELRAMQESNQLAGGANPQDRPGLARAQKALSPGVPASALVHGAVGALEGALGRPGAAAWQGGRLADILRSRGPLNPAQRPLPARVLGIPGAVAGTGLSAGQDYLTRDRELQ